MKNTTRYCLECKKAIKKGGVRVSQKYCSKKCYLVHFKPLWGEKFGNLTVMEFKFDRYGHNYWLFKCSCGVEKVTSLQHVRSGKIRSCGHLVTTIGGLSRNREMYRRWQHMLRRCYNPKDAHYSSYGGRGITVDERWHIFENYLNDVTPSYKKSLTLDRVDNNKGYSRDNFRWATPKEQANNRRDHVTQKWFEAISPNGVKYKSNNQSKFAGEHNIKQYGISNSLIKGHYAMGWKFKWL